MAKKLYIKTHGCQMNEYDSARMADLLKTGETVEMTDSPDDADILLLNTCSIREKAQEKVFHQLGRWKKLKSKKPEMIIGVGGCVAWVVLAFQTSRSGRVQASSKARRTNMHFYVAC